MEHLRIGVGFKGVLASDYYPGYDSIPSMQQSCLTDVLGPQRNACPGTLTPSGFGCCFFDFEQIRAGVAGSNRPAEVGGGGQRSRPQTVRRLPL